MAENAYGVTRDNVRSQENTDTEAGQPAIPPQAQSTVAPPASLSSRMLSYAGMLLALLVGIALLGLGFGMWKASQTSSTSNTFDGNQSTTVLNPGSSPQNTSTNVTNFDTRYFESTASFSQY